MPKNIVLFSDGTGNSSAKLFKTNVWRLYEALDLGPPIPGRECTQIAYYDNGVGTSNFRPFAMLGGVFGWGLKRNVLTIYKYLCRNYRDGDGIYCFGFSRGAFTIRLVAGLIANQGIVEYRNERQLAYHACDAYREFSRSMWPNRQPAKFLAPLIRRVRDGLLRAKRFLFRERLYRDTAKAMPDIDFLGVWDTVAAYGGPIAEITRGVDDWIWPLTMPDYELSPKVKAARHALSIDDKRDSFQPVLWDEVREAHAVEHGRTVTVRFEGGRPVTEVRRPKPGRIQQVWFSGVHSDVGGGYPDETLSFVSLLWMIGEIEELKKARHIEGLTLLAEHETRIRTMSNPFGPLHNSREGYGSYYRYQPRNLAAFVDPSCDPDQPEHLYRSLRDPEVRRDGFKDHALLTEIKLHRSVMTRVESGTDRYAPINLPAQWRVVPTEEVEHPKEGDKPGFQIRPGTVDQWARVWDFVWWRRLTYFITVMLSSALASMPLWTKDAVQLEICDDARCWGRSAVGLLDYVLPSFATTWTSAFTANFGAFAVLVVALLISMGIGSWLEKKTSDVTRSLLEARAGAKHPGWSAVRAFRESPPYQWFMRNIKWRVFPFLAAATLVLLVMIGLASAGTQTALYFAEREGKWGDQQLCLQTDRKPEAGTRPGGVLWATKSMCTPLEASVVKDRRYEVTVTIVEPWNDNGVPLEAAGEPIDFPLVVDLFAPLRRVIVERWYQPMIAIRPAAGAGDEIYVDRLSLSPKPGHPGVLRGVFEAPRNGNLSIFVNDAVLPRPIAYFYDNNGGTARVSVVPTASVRR